MNVEESETYAASSSVPHSQLEAGMHALRAPRDILRGGISRLWKIIFSRENGLNVAFCDWSELKIITVHVTDVKPSYHSSVAFARLETTELAFTFRRA